MKNQEIRSGEHTWDCSSIRSGEQSSPWKIKAAGISLITLIITIIVIIILAAIVIFTGLNTPDRANFAKFTQEFADFQTAVTQDFFNKKTEYSLKGTQLTDAEIYYLVATNGTIDGSEVTIDSSKVKPISEIVDGKGVKPNLPEGTNAYILENDTNIQGWKQNKKYYDPNAEKHYITDKGELFIWPGYKVTDGNETRWYISSSKYYVGEGSTLAENPTTPEEPTDGLKIGKAYDENKIKIGDKLTYTSSGESNWIVFGKDKDGNVLLTTEAPVADGFNLQGGAEAWLKYESETDETYGLNYACSGYGGTIQGKTIKSRSINMTDINNVMGVNLPEFDTWTFGSSEYNETNKTANYWYPVLSGGTGPDGTGTGFWQDPTKKSETFKNDWYYYYKGGENVTYYDAKNDEGDTSIVTKPGNLELVTGEDGSYVYVVASRAVGVDSRNAYFRVAYVNGGDVDVDGNYLCDSYSSEGYDSDDYGLVPVRPIVILPSDILVEEQANGTYDIK